MQIKSLNSSALTQSVFVSLYATLTLTPVFIFCGNQNTLKNGMLLLIETQAKYMHSSEFYIGENGKRGFSGHVTLHLSLTHQRVFSVYEHQVFVEMVRYCRNFIVVDRK